MIILSMYVPNIQIIDFDLHDSKLSSFIMVKSLVMGVTGSQLRVRSKHNVSITSIQQVLNTTLGAYE